MVKKSLISAEQPTIFYKKGGLDSGIVKITKNVSNIVLRNLVLP